MIYFKNFLIVIYYILLVYGPSGSYKCGERGRCSRQQRRVGMERDI